MEKDIYLKFKKVYLEMKIMLEQAKIWDSTTLEDLNKIKDSEKLLEDSWKIVEEKYGDLSATNGSEK